MPAGMPARTAGGSASITASRRPVGASARNARPATRFAASASCQVKPIAPQTVKTKNTLCPIAGASANGWLASAAMRKQASAEATQVAKSTPPGSMPASASSAGWTKRM